MNESKRPYGEEAPRVSGRAGPWPALLGVLSFLTTGCEKTADFPAKGPTLEIVATLPHDRSSFTQGLLVENGFFFESTGLEGESTVRRLSLESGEVADSRALEERYFGEGLASLDHRLYQLTWKHGLGFVYDPSTLEQIGTFRYDGEGWGLTTDGSSLILSDGTYRLKFIDPATFRVTRTIEVSDAGQVVYALNELEWVNGEVWANIWQADDIARIDPQTGAVKGWVNVQGFISRLDRWRGADVANGIAYDSVSGRLWVTGKNWPRIYEVSYPR